MLSAPAMSRTAVALRSVGVSSGARRAAFTSRTFMSLLLVCGAWRNIGRALSRLHHGRMKSAHGQESERDKSGQHHKLCNDKRWLRLRRRQRLQERQLPKGLNDRHEDIKIERDHRGDDVDPAPCRGEVKPVKGNNSECEQYEG